MKKNPLPVERRPPPLLLCVVLWSRNYSILVDAANGASLGRVVETLSSLSYSSLWIDHPFGLKFEEWWGKEKERRKGLWSNKGQASYRISRKLDWWMHARSNGTEQWHTWMPIHMCGLHISSFTVRAEILSLTSSLSSIFWDLFFFLDAAIFYYLSIYASPLNTRFVSPRGDWFSAEVFGTSEICKKNHCDEVTEARKVWCRRIRNILCISVAAAA